MIVDGHEMTKSHSEAEIYKGCLSLMNKLVGYFEEYLDDIGVEPTPDGDEGHFKVELYPTEIVERLFLWGTHHSGGTSQHLKCEELGIDTDETVVFEDERGRENDA